MKALSMLVCCAAMASAQTGWIEGSVTNREGKAVWVHSPSIDALDIRVSGPSTATTVTKMNMNGFYSLKDLKPGIYDVYVIASRYENSKYRPRIIRGVVVKADVRTVLDIVVNEGERVEETGQSVTSEHALLAGRELARLAREVELLKQQAKAAGPR